MREATVQDLKKESQVLTDAWTFLKKWYFIDTGDQWAQLMGEARELYTKADNNELSKDVILAIISYIEKAYLQREQVKQPA